ncbi:MAG TPA: DUF4214 domain-containing protein [Burkholderiaceae bacterium]
MKTRLVVLLAVSLLAACGGSDTASIGTSQQTQFKIERPAQKQQNAGYAIVVQSLYMAYFGRPADPAGLVNFEAALASANAPANVVDLAAQYTTNPALKALIDGFGTSQESKNLYGNNSTDFFVIEVFNNVVGRPPLSGGLSFWANAIDSGQLSRGNAALAIMAGALSNTSTQGKVDAQLINNRLSLASYFTAQLTAFGVTGSYTGAAAAANARNLLSNVTTTTVVPAYQSVVASSVAAMVGSGPIVEMFAGTTGGPGNVNGTAKTARFSNPYDVVMDSANNLYVADASNRVIRKVAPNGNVSTYAGAMGQSGSTDGAAADARFTFPTSIAIDATGNLYVVDNDTVRKIDPAGQVTTIAGQAGVSGAANGPAVNATFSNMGGIAVDHSGNIYVGDNCAIRIITPQGQVSTFSGTLGAAGTVDGSGSAATFDHPGKIAIDSSGNLYVVEIVTPIVRKISPGGDVVTIAGNPAKPGSADGNGAAAQFSALMGAAVDANDNLYVTDYGSNNVRKIDPKGNVTHYAGQSNFTGGYADGAAAGSRFSSPFGICADAGGNLYVADTYNAVVRKIDTSQTVSTYAGQNAMTADVDGAGSAARFSGPAGMGVDSSGNLYVADVTGPTVRKVTPGGVVTTFAGQSGVTGAQGLLTSPLTFQAPNSVAVDKSNNVFIGDSALNRIVKVAPDGTSSIAFGVYPYSSPQLGDIYIPTMPQTFTVDPLGNIYFVDTLHYRICKVTPNGVAAIYAGFQYSDIQASDGNLATATFSLPTAIAGDPAGNLYVIDYNTIRKIDTAGNVSTVAGSTVNFGYQDGNASTALFAFPTSLAIDTHGNIYVADYGNNAIRKVTPSGMVSTLVGQQGVVGFQTGSAPAELAHPRGLAIYGNALYVSMEKGVVAVYNLP